MSFDIAEVVLENFPLANDIRVDVRDKPGAHDETDEALVIYDQLTFHGAAFPVLVRYQMRAPPVRLKSELAQYHHAIHKALRRALSQLRSACCGGDCNARHAIRRDVFGQNL